MNKAVDRETIKARQINTNAKIYPMEHGYGVSEVRQTWQMN